MSTILRYVFATGEAIELEVEDEYAAVVLKDRKDEGNRNRNERRHKISLDRFTHEERKFFGDENTPETILIRREENEVLFEQLEVCQRCIREGSSCTLTA